MILPLCKGRVSIKDQAVQLGLDVPVGKTVAEIRALGFDTDIDWPDIAVLHPDKESPTGFVVRWPFDEQTAVWALAT